MPLLAIFLTLKKNMQKIKFFMTIICNLQNILRCLYYEVEVIVTLVVCSYTR